MAGNLWVTRKPAGLDPWVWVTCPPKTRGCGFGFWEVQVPTNGYPNPRVCTHAQPYKWHIQKNCCSKKKKKEGTESGKGKDSANMATGGEEFAFTTTFVGAMLTHNSNPLARVETNVYDSGVSSHMSPTCNQFTTFTAITPKPIKAADQTLFIATAMGELWVSIPNGKSTMAITLKDVLYCLDLAFTLISLTGCDMAGYSALLKDRQCTISNPHGLVLGQLPLTEGLYKHVYAPKSAETANLTQKTLSLDDLH